METGTPSPDTSPNSSAPASEPVFRRASPPSVCLGCLKQLTSEDFFRFFGPQEPFVICRPCLEGLSLFERSLILLCSSYVEAYSTLQPTPPAPQVTLFPQEPLDDTAPLSPVPNGLIAMLQQRRKDIHAGRS